jgi:hypothetical protein
VVKSQLGRSGVRGCAHAHLGIQILAAQARLAERTQIAQAEQDLLGHVDCPDAGATANVENAGLPVLRNRRLVQLVSPCDGEQLVVDVHAVFFMLGGRLAGAAALHRAGLPRRKETCTFRVGTRGRDAHFPGSCSWREQPACRLVSDPRARCTSAESSPIPSHRSHLSSSAGCSARGREADVQDNAAAGTTMRGE